MVSASIYIGKCVRDVNGTRKFILRSARALAYVAGETVTVEFHGEPPIVVVA